MRKILIASLLVSSPALADFTAKDASLATITFKNPNVCTSVACVPIFQQTDGSGAAIGVAGSPLYFAFGTGVQLPAFASPPAVSVNNFPATQPISAAALPLPSGASTSAAQATGNSSLSSIDGKTPALGQALAAASVPVVLTAAQLATLTPLSSVSVSNFPASQPVTNAGTFAVQNTAALPTGSNVIGSISNTAFGISGTLPAFAATPTVNVGTMPTTTVTGTVTANLGTIAGVATAAAQTGGSQKTQIVDGSGNVIASTTNALNVNCANCSGGGGGGTSSNFAATFPTAGTAAGMSQGGNMVALTGTGGSLNANVTNFPATQPVSGTFWQATQPVSGTFFQATQPVSNAGTFATQVTSLPALPAGANAIGSVSVSNFPGTQAVSGTVTANLGTANVTNAGTFAVQVTSAPSTAVTNAGTFATQVTSLPSIPTGSNTIGALTANQTVNNALVAGTAISVGNGVSGTGVQRVAIASDNSPVPMSKTLSSAAASGATVISTSAIASSLVTKSSAGNLYSMEVSANATLAASTWYIMVFNATSLPANGAITPAKCFTVPANTLTFTAAWPNPIQLGTGITIGVSTTGCFTQTASANAYISADYQ